MHASSPAADTGERDQAGQQQWQGTEQGTLDGLPTGGRRSGIKAPALVSTGLMKPDTPVAKARGPTACCMSGPHLVASKPTPGIAGTRARRSLAMRTPSLGNSVESEPQTIALPLN